MRNNAFLQEAPSLTEKKKITVYSIDSMIGR